MKPVQAIAFTASGAKLCVELCRSLMTEAEGFAPERYCTDGLRPIDESLSEWTKRRFRTGFALVFIGAAGIAVRAIAPYVRHKSTDPAVVVMDEKGQRVIPLLSGHIGGANRLAGELAALTGGEVVLTTATDVNGVFSPDAWAAENGYAVEDTTEIKHIAACLLDGEPVGIQSDLPIHGELPKGIVPSDSTRCGIQIGLEPSKPFDHTLHFIPRSIIAGIGCRRGTAADMIRKRLEQVLAGQGLPVQAVGAIATIDLKADEPGLISLSEELGAPMLCFEANELAALDGEFTSSERVANVTGVDNVCERAAVLAGGELLTRKYAGEGVTVALSIRPWKVLFMTD